jgi:pimeloyl-[acyl-carrier protein] methyl ester esterase
MIFDHRTIGLSCCYSLCYKKNLKGQLLKLILMPGLDGTGNMFQPFISSLGDEIQPHIISYPSDRYLSYDELSNFALDRLKKIDDQLVLLAESFSGPVAIKLLQDSLPSIKAVIFSATFCGSPKSFLVSLSKFLPVATILKLPIPNAVIKYLCFGYDCSPETIDLFKTTIAKSNAKVLSQRIIEISRLKFKEQNLSNIPCCYIQAQYDKLVPESAFQSFQQIAPDIQLIKINGPHFILQAKPQECKESIVKFIRKIL